MMVLTKSLLVIAMLMPSLVLSQTTSTTSREVSLRIGMGYGVGKALLSSGQSKQDNTIVVLGSRIVKRPARFLRRVEFSENHLAIEGLDKRNNVIYQDALIDPRFIRFEQITKGRFGNRNDFYRAVANLNVVLPNDPRIVNLRIASPRWNGTNFEFESLAVIPMRKLR